MTSDSGLLSAFTVMPGISSSDSVGQFLLPPDNATAANTASILQAVNDVVRWTNPDGSNAVEQAMTTFFAPLPNYGYFLDPRSLYNATTDQFILTAGTAGAANGTTTNGNAYVLLAVSHNGDPNSGWNEYRYQFSPTANAIDVSDIDQPSVAADGNTIFVSASVGSEQLELVIAGDGAGPVQQIDLGRNDLAGIYKQIAAPGKGDYALAQNNGVVTLRHINSAGSVDATGSVTLGSVGTPAGSLSATGGEQYVATAGTSQPLDAGDARLYGLTAPVNGIMYATFEVTPTSGPDAGTPNTHWVKLNVSDPSHMTLVGQDTVAGSMISAGVGTAMGSVAVNGAGDTILNFIASGPSLAPTDYFEIRRAGEATFSAPVAWDSSAGAYFEPGAARFGPEIASRFGDYSSAVADPGNAHAFYISNEVGTEPGGAGWSTPIAHVVVPAGVAV